MTQRQQEAFIMLKEAIRKFDNCENIYLAFEDAKALKRIIENQEGYIKELIEENKNLQDKIDSTSKEKKFISKYCNKCGSQRCEGINSEWFEGCIYKNFLNT